MTSFRVNRGVRCVSTAYLCLCFSPSRQSSHSHSRLYQQTIGEPTCISSSIGNLRRPYDSYDDAGNSSSPSSKCASSVSSPYIRRTPFARRSLPHHIQPVLKKPLKPVLSSSPDPFKTTVKREQQLRHVVLAEPSLPPAVAPSKSSLERHFSDLSLNQIENDSLAPSASAAFAHSRPSLSYSSGSASSSSSSSTDDSAAPFLNIQMNGARCDVLHRGDSIPLVFSSNASSTGTGAAPPTSKSSSFIHNVSITV